MSEAACAASVAKSNVGICQETALYIILIYTQIKMR